MSMIDPKPLQEVCGRPHCSFPYLPSDQALPWAGPSLGVPSWPDQGRPPTPGTLLQAGPQSSVHTGIPEAGPHFLSLQIPPPPPQYSIPGTPGAGSQPLFLTDALETSHLLLLRPYLHRNPQQAAASSSGLPPNRDPGGRPPAPSAAPTPYRGPQQNPLPLAIPHSPWHADPTPFPSRRLQSWLKLPSSRGPQLFPPTAAQSLAHSSSP